MKSFFFLFACCLFPFFCGAQSKYDLKPIDSKAISPNFKGNVIDTPKGFAVFNEVSMTLYRFSEAFEFVDSIKFIPPKELYYRHVLRNIVFEVPEGFVFISQQHHLVYYDAAGHFIKAFHPKLKYKGQKFRIEGNISRLLNSFNPLYNPDTRTFFIGLSAINRWDTTKKKFYEKYFLIKYRQKGVIGEFDMEGRLINVYGAHNSIYAKKLYVNYLDNCFFDKYADDKLAYSFQLSDSIYLVNTTHAESKAFGKRGKYMNMSFEEVPEIHSSKEYFLDEYSNLIKSPFYHSLNVADNFIIRTYTISEEDTVTIDSSDLELRTKWLTGELKACLGETKTERAQFKLLKSKPFYVQIYDRSTYELLYDGPIRESFPLFLAVKDGKFYFYDSDSSRIVGYQLAKN